MKQQLTTMLEMQDAMNTKVHADWRQRNHEWYRAIWIECAELLDHYGWKWWKKQQPDRDQVILELVDIWHFGLSIVLSNESSVDDKVAKLCEELDFADVECDFASDVEVFAATTLTTKTFDVTGFSRLMCGIGLSFDELYRRYVGKNVLNFFRQDHGYKEGTYRKTWQGKEDNEHLVEIIEQLDTTQQGFKDTLYTALSDRYKNSSENNL
ncbi:dUTP diphosphatase [Agarilytica rhodophyticola]|uniref:dUTP diphosphatase n=1 Tax=Agarilytica rhodophyticola TaxID=1737490 RepID=UPI000B3444E7|nr:dUTP diphosphatase [Agarilytica rhodophyticola]